MMWNLNFTAQSTAIYNNQKYRCESLQGSRRGNRKQIIKEEIKWRENKPIIVKYGLYYIWVI